MKMESIESTNGYLYESSMANDTVTLLDKENKHEEVNQIPDFLNSAQIIYRILLGLITVTGLVGNILTVAVILRNKGIKSITDILILSLAETDILFIVSGLPKVILGDYQIRWSVGNEWCRLIDYVTYVCDYASMYMLVLISLDRYLALVHPIRSMPYRTKRGCYILIIVIWSIVLLGNMPMLFENQFCSDEEERKDSYMQIHFICFFVFAFMLPLLFMCILYGHILKSFHNANIPGVNNTTSRVRLISNRRLTKMVIVTIMVFIICRLPFHILLLYASIVIYFENPAVFIIPFIVFLCMLYLNCCINPIVYGFHSKTFRKGFRDVLRCKT